MAQAVHRPVSTPEEASNTQSPTRNHTITITTTYQLWVGTCTEYQPSAITTRDYTGLRQSFCSLFGSGGTPKWGNRAANRHATSTSRSAAARWAVTCHPLPLGPPMHHIRECQTCIHGGYGNGKPGRAVETTAPFSRRGRLHESFITVVC